jgi:hypothetical protein
MEESSETEELTTASFWDKRYDSPPTDSSSTGPTYEWLRGFDSLKPWLKKHLFDVRPAEQNPRILNLGCGDSVCVS